MPEPTESERLAAARRLARWELGDPSWAEIILDAYRNPAETNARIDAQQAAYDFRYPAAKK